MNGPARFQFAMWVVMIAVPCVGFAQHRQQTVEQKECGAIEIMNEYVSIAQVEDVEHARQRLDAADAWYKRCKSKLLPLDRQWIDIRVSSAQESLGWPRTIEQAVKEIVSELSAEDRAAVRAKAREDLIEFHMGWGMGIRNGLGLWRGNHALLSSVCQGQPCHPDDASMKIIEAIWESLQDAPAQLSN